MLSALPTGATVAAAPAQCSLSAGAYSGSNGPPETAPVARFTVSPAMPVPLQAATFDASHSSDADGDSIVSYRWDFGDGSPITTTSSSTIKHTFPGGGTFPVTLMVTDCRDSTGRTTTQVTTGAGAITVIGGGSGSAPVCRSRRKVRVALPHGRGIRDSSATLTGSGHRPVRFGARQLRGKTLSVSLYGFRKRPAHLAISVSGHGRPKTVTRTLHPCG